MKKIIIFIFLLFTFIGISKLIITQENIIAEKRYKKFNEYNVFFKIASKWAVIPGLKENLVPQGLAYYPKKNWFIISFYRINSMPSVLAIIDANNGILIKAIEIYNLNGTPYKGHAGGIAISENNLWISSNSYLWRIPLNDIINSENGSKVKIIDGFNTGTRASFVEYNNGVLWAGEFYHKGNYTTDISHHLVSNNGTKHYAWIAGFKLNPKTDNVTKNTPIIPDMILSIPDIVQDIEFIENKKIILSRSYGRNNDSLLQIYSYVLNQSPDTTIQLFKKKVPVWFLNKMNLETEIVILPMSEGITKKDNSLYILFESSASKYRFTTKYPTDFIWDIKIESLNTYKSKNKK
ncbi:hypothetical protein JCM30566_13030 [Marinitoga arctica]